MIAELARTAWSVALAVLPLAALFLIFQVVFLKLPRHEVSRVLIGTLLASAGLFLFLLGVAMGFLPFGRAIGAAAGSLEPKWLLLPFGALLGFVTAWSEPSVRVLAEQVDEASSGSIRGSSVLYAVCIGAALATGIGLVRVGYGIPLLWLLVPGYLLVLVIMRATETEFVSVAIDAGGVATGPLANSFLLALALGAASAVGVQDPLERGLGLVALISLAPVISVMALGFLVRRKLRRKES
jgi:hypothetical protein